MVPEHQASVLKSNPQTPWDALDSSITVWTIPAENPCSTGWGKQFQNGERSRGWSIKGKHIQHQRGQRGGMAGGWREHRGSFVRRSQRCSVPALSGQMAGQHLLVRQEADKKYDLSLSQHGFSSSFFFQSVEYIQSIISAWD